MKSRSKTTNVLNTFCIITLSVLFFCTTKSFAQNTGLFLPYLTYDVGSWPEAVAIGDVNGDGLNDVVMTTSYYFDPQNDYHIHVFLQNISGELEPPVKYSTSSSYGNRSESIAIGDLNNDGKADVVVGNSGDNIEIFLQNASGDLNPGISYQTTNSHSIKIGDLNNDGLLDVVGIGWGTNTADVLLQNVNGTLDFPVIYSVTHGGWDEVDVGDVNNDGLDDIVVMSGQSYIYPNVGILQQLPDGTFDSPVYYDLGKDVNTNGVAVGDINSDQLQDIVVSYGGNRPNSQIGIFLQNESGTLNPVVSQPSYDIPESIDIADVNLDGKNDVIVLHGGWNAMGVYLQSIDGSLMPYELYPLPYASSYTPQGLAIGDINGDQLVDIVIADYNYGLVVLKHSPVDDDGDGYNALEDCNDNDASIYPDAPEIKHDNIDQDCDGYDLTIDIITADYDKMDQVKVKATSALGSAANLYLEGYGPMTWKKGQKNWQIVAKPAGGDPMVVTVCGIEGCDSAGTNAKPRGK